MRRARDHQRIRRLQGMVGVVLVQRPREIGTLIGFAIDKAAGRVGWSVGQLDWLDDPSSKAILALAIIFAILAGLPLPLIGVILGRIINNFPPNADELKQLLYRLMSVAVGYFLVTWGWSVCWAVTGERVSRKTRERLLHRALGMDMAYYGTFVLENI